MMAVGPREVDQARLLVEVARLPYEADKDALLMFQLPARHLIDLLESFVAVQGATEALAQANAELEARQVATAKVSALMSELYFALTHPSVHDDDDLQVLKDEFLRVQRTVRELDAPLQPHTKGRNYDRTPTQKPWVF